MDKAISIAKPIMSSQDVTHDWAHILRVLAYAREIMDGISCVFDREIVEIGCILHDIADHKYETKVNVEEVLSSLCFDEERTEKIRQIIHRTSWSVQKKEQNPNLFEELRIVRDADKLDAMCDEGVLRAFGTAAVRGTPMFMKATPSYEKWSKEGALILEEDGSLIGHLYAKLLHIHKFLYFEISRKIAKPHEKRFEAFVKRAELFRG
ncbi:metal dependent phosphohydrolase [Melbournevirus]|uniref:metal dependent phosphohydrolase n=1 Tax=Melbournevirus TaxID=1560514 RepID=UPI00051F545B|nr:metal dependent phosphohydrolase [Melbournevirus]AIT54675.1 metal dependent phosphohydrolase [Melbournevirus]